MLDLDQLQILGQLTDNLDIMINKLEKSFEANNGEEFAKSKKEILGVQNKINSLINEK